MVLLSIDACVYIDHPTRPPPSHMLVRLVSAAAQIRPISIDQARARFWRAMKLLPKGTSDDSLGNKNKAFETYSGSRQAEGNCGADPAAIGRGSADRAGGDRSKEGTDGARESAIPAVEALAANVAADGAVSRDVRAVPMSDGRNSSSNSVALAPAVVVVGAAAKSKHNTHGSTRNRTPLPHAAASVTAALSAAFAAAIDASRDVNGAAAGQMSKMGKNEPHTSAAPTASQDSMSRAESGEPQKSVARADAAQAPPAAASATLAIAGSGATGAIAVTEPDIDPKILPQMGKGFKGRDEAGVQSSAADGAANASETSFPAAFAATPPAEASTDVALNAGATADAADGESAHGAVDREDNMDVNGSQHEPTGCEKRSRELSTTSAATADAGPSSTGAMTSPTNKNDTAEAPTRDEAAATSANRINAKARPTSLNSETAATASPAAADNRGNNFATREEGLAVVGRNDAATSTEGKDGGGDGGPKNATKGDKAKDTYEGIPAKQQKRKDKAEEAAVTTGEEAPTATASVVPEGKMTKPPSLIPTSEAAAAAGDARSLAASPEVLPPPMEAVLKMRREDGERGSGGGATDRLYGTHCLEREIAARSFFREQDLLRRRFQAAVDLVELDKAVECANLELRSGCRTVQAIKMRLKSRWREGVVLPNAGGLARCTNKSHQTEQKWQEQLKIVIADHQELLQELIGRQKLEAGALQMSQKMEISKGSAPLLQVRFAFPRMFEEVS